jgi:hypothetical protein
MMLSGLGIAMDDAAVVRCGERVGDVHGARQGSFWPPEGDTQLIVRIGSCSLAFSYVQECGMRALAGLVLVALVGGVGLFGCGSVSAKQQDAGTDAAADAQTLLCTANAKSCGMDDALYECNADGTSLSKIQDCQYGCATDHCKQCASNTTFCDGNDLAMCSSDGMITNPQTCVHGCQMDRCNTCDPGTNFCDSSGNAVTCGQNGMPASTMSCGAAGCAGGVCNQCTPNTTSCQGDTLVNCNAAGMVASTTSCALGCSTTGSVHCKQLVPSYGVPAPSGTLANLLVDANGTLDLTNCPNSVALTVGMTSSTLVSPQVSVVNQTGGPPICVVRFGTITINSGVSLTIVNTAAGHVLSLQATGDVQIDGTLGFANNAPGPSPGADGMVFGTKSNGDRQAAGAGGGGAAYAGGMGGSYDPDSGMFDLAGGDGGAAITTISTRLTAGSAGGNVMENSTRVATGGKGGGALHVVSLTRVIVGATGVINVNGFGGGGAGILTNGDLPAAGGGAGGTLVVEAPTVSFSTGAIAAANGGGGAGGCYGCSMGLCFHATGQAGQLSLNRAAGGDCSPTGGSLGDGGYEANGDAPPPYIEGWESDLTATTVSGGGGGGSRGFMILRGRASSSVMLATGSIVSPVPTLGAVTAN